MAKDTNNPPKHTLMILATATRELQNDVLSIHFTASETGIEPNEVQEALRKKVAEALEIVRPLLKSGEVEVETSGFSVQPRYTKKSEISGYIGQTALTVKGTDTATISSLASDIKSMIVAGTSNSVSRKLRASVEKELTKEAIHSFRDKASAAAEAFGYPTWLPGAINVQVDRDYGNRGGARLMAASMSMEAGGGTQMEVESGKTEVNATVSGTIIIHSL